MLVEQDMEVCMEVRLPNHEGFCFNAIGVIGVIHVVKFDHGITGAWGVSRLEGVTGIDLHEQPLSQTMRENMQMSMTFNSF